ncbi:MAG: DnaJ domain-containing protein [Alphaproteobacteria bacterium]
MGALIAGLAVLLILLLLFQGFVSADPKSLAKSIRIAGGILLSLLAAGLALSGRLLLALIAGSVALALFTRGPMPWQRFRTAFGAGAGGAGGGDARPRTSRMSRAEAFSVLGLSEGATPDEIRAAHRRLIKQAHPDIGGSSYLAAKINEAKDVLLGEA